MRKRVTFVEHMKKENLLKNGKGLISTRSAEPNRRCMDGIECLPVQQVRKVYRGTHINMPMGDQHMKTIYMPKTLISAPLLQHPALTAGQRRYLCSIANVYSTEHIRRQMKQHYLNVLHTCVQWGQSPTCKKRQRDGNSVFPKDAEKDVDSRAKPQGRRKGSTAATTDVIFPKIVKR